jgi:hypothetical protein
MDQEYTGVLNTDGTHSDAYPFCPDLTCPCHEDRWEIENATDYLTDGLMTIDEVDRYYRGQTI